MKRCLLLALLAACGGERAPGAADAAQPAPPRGDAAVKRTAAAVDQVTISPAELAAPAPYGRNSLRIAFRLLNGPQPTRELVITARCQAGENWWRDTARVSLEGPSPPARILEARLFEREGSPEILQRCDVAFAADGRQVLDACWTGTEHREGRCADLPAATDQGPPLVFRDVSFEPPSTVRFTLVPRRPVARAGLEIACNNGKDDAPIDLGGTEPGISEHRVLSPFAKPPRKPPTRCELRFQSAPPEPPSTWCWQDGRTAEGACR